MALEGSSGREILANPSFGLKEVGNISFMSNTQNPEDFYKQARVIIVPSFFNESYARVVAEAMAAGVPVVASNRGALPETVGDAGLILDIPQCYQPQTTLLPMDYLGDPTALLTHPTLLSPLLFGDGMRKIKTCTLLEDGKNQH